MAEVGELPSWVARYFGEEMVVLRDEGREGHVVFEDEDLGVAVGVCVSEDGEVAEEAAAAAEGGEAGEFDDALTGEEGGVSVGGVERLGRGEVGALELGGHVAAAVGAVGEVEDVDSVEGLGEEGGGWEGEGHDMFGFQQRSSGCVLRPFGRDYEGEGRNGFAEAGSSESGGKPLKRGTPSGAPNSQGNCIWMIAYGFLVPFPTPTPQSGLPKAVSEVKMGPEYSNIHGRDSICVCPAEQSLARQFS